MAVGEWIDVPTIKQHTKSASVQVTVVVLLAAIRWVSDRGLPPDSWALTVWHFAHETASLAILLMLVLGGLMEAWRQFKLNWSNAALIAL